MPANQYNFFGKIEALVKVHDGVAGAHLGGTNRLMEIKARFQRLGTTKKVYFTANDV